MSRVLTEITAVVGFKLEAGALKVNALEPPVSVSVLGLATFALVTVLAPLLM